jgi:hypothetical protein
METVGKTLGVEKGWNVEKIETFITKLLLLPWRFFRALGRGVLILAAVALLLGIAVEAFSYWRDSHRFLSSGACPAVEAELKTFSVSIHRSFRCLNANPNHPPLSQSQGIVFFMANVANPSLEDTGHGWVVWVQASQNPTGALEVHEFLPIGFGPSSLETKWPGWAQNFYLKQVVPRLPRVVETGLSRLLGVAWLPLAVHPEAPTGFTGTRVIDVAAIQSPTFRQVFGNNPEAALVVLLSDTEYQNTKKVAERFATGDYSLYFRDCTTFVEEVAGEAGLYVPPRFLNPLPSDYISLLSKMNRR